MGTYMGSPWVVSIYHNVNKCDLTQYVYDNSKFPILLVGYSLLNWNFTGVLNSGGLHNGCLHSGGLPYGGFHI